MRLAKWIFAIAGVYGLLALVPSYFLVDLISQQHPPAITHPEYYYAFVGVALAWQFAFLLVASDPIRYRPIMLIGIGEKLGFFVPALILKLQNNIPTPTFGVSCIDLFLACLFFVAYRKTSPAKLSA